MCSRRLEMAQAAFCSTSACFSEDEWMLLQEWQKELYGNVMKEIHRALMSLGPLIATTVYTLRDKEQQDVAPFEEQRCERKSSMNGSLGETISNSHELSGLKREAPSHLDNPGDLGGTEHMDGLSTGDTFISFCVKEEDAAYCVYRPEIPSAQICSIPTNDPVFVSVKLEEEEASFQQVPSSKENAADKKRKKRKGETGPSTGGSQNTTSIEGLHGRMMALDSKENVINSGRETWYGNIVVLEEEETINHESTAAYSEHFKPQQGPSSTQISDERKDSGSRLWNANLLTYHPIAQINSKPFACTECKNVFRTEVELTRHQRTHLGERPFRCTICEMSFIYNHHLNQHQRIHTGERPYQCPKCKKRFSLKGNLNKHQRKQTSRCKSPLGARPPTPSESQP